MFGVSFVYHLVWEYAFALYRSLLCRKSGAINGKLRIIFTQLWILLYATSCNPRVGAHVWVFQHFSAGASITKLWEHKIFDCMSWGSGNQRNIRETTMMISVHFTLLFIWVTQGKVYSLSLNWTLAIKCVKYMCMYSIMRSSIENHVLYLM